MKFQPDYNNITDAAWNRPPKRIPLYEHIISTHKMEEYLGISFADLHDGNDRDKAEFFRRMCDFFLKLGYDTVSYECLISAILPGSGALYGHREGCIRDKKDFDGYPWESVADIFFDTYAENYEILRGQLPTGMKVAGGPGNGLFECVQDIVGYTQLCYFKSDDPDVYAGLFEKMGDVFMEIWTRFLPAYGDMLALGRFGDDLGYKGGTLLDPADIRTIIIPQYRRIIDLIHASGKPFLLHSCGNIFGIMPDLIESAGINAKHSNEDVIAPFPEWVKRYGDRIGNFGGVDAD
ncbi:MAG: hypothetical protein E4H36_14930, partial [Spirochaetales bacterium]